MKKRDLLTFIISVILIIAVILSAFYLPEYFLSRYAESGNNQLIIPPVEADQINNTALSVMASMQLQNYEKMRLISHSWEGSSESVGAEYSDEDAHSMVELAKSRLKEYYRVGLYPTDFTSNDGASWYNWEANRYCSTDATFHRFSAYYWVIKLVKYDQTETHWIMIMEDGTILAAGCQTQFPKKSIVRMSLRYASLPIIRGRSCTYTELKTDERVPYYEDLPIDPSPTSVGELSIKLKNGTEDYYLMQQINTTYGSLHYGFQIIPFD